MKKPSLFWQIIPPCCAELCEKYDWENLSMEDDPSLFGPDSFLDAAEQDTLADYLMGPKHSRPGQTMKQRLREHAQMKSFSAILRKKDTVPVYIPQTGPWSTKLKIKSVVMADRVTVTKGNTTSYRYRLTSEFSHM